MSDPHKAALIAALDALATIDPDIAQAIDQLGYPEPRIRPAGFETFLSTIVSQQISTAAARSIMGKVRALLPKISAETLLALPENALREAGLSQRKAEYAVGLAQAVIDRRFVPDRLTEMGDTNAIETITELRGFGRWSAEIYLMFSLQRPDIFPADDLALQQALQQLKGLDAKPTAKQARELTNHWAPWRSAGSVFLWHYYHGAPA